MTRFYLLFLLILIPIFSGVSADYYLGDGSDDKSANEGDILYFSGDYFKGMPRGTDGQVLKSTATTIAWGTDNTGAGGGSDVKSGIINNISEGGTGSVTFATAFSSTPFVTVSFCENTDFTSNEKAVDLAITARSTTAFTVRYDGVDAPSLADVCWIATDAGDP